MKTFKRQLYDGGENLNRNMIAKLSKYVLIIISIMCCMKSNAQNNDKVISITGTQFTYPLIKRWISEYSKINPEIRIQLLNEQEKSGPADLKIIAHTPEKGEIGDNKTLVKVGRLAVLPITNDKTNLFSKEFKKGIKREGLKAIFMKDESKLDSNGDKEKEPEYTVYTNTPQSCTAKVISTYLGNSSDDLQGIYVSGNDSYLITSVLEDSTGVSYNNLGLIYDLEKRIPVKGIKILPIDLNNNGHLDKGEQIYSNLDQLITILEETKNISIPTDYMSFVIDKKLSDPEISNFLDWVKEFGQQYNHQYGFLNTSVSKNTAYTQK